MHGANFCLLYAPGTGAVTFAKRSGVLQESDDFYGFRSSALDMRLQRLVQDTPRALARLGVEPESVMAVHFFCELFGGKYVDIVE